MAKKKGKPMSAALKSFLKKNGRFPRKGELGRGPASPGRGHRTTRLARRSSSASPAGPARVGRWYQGASTGLAVLAPVTDSGIVIATERRAPNLGDLPTIS